MNVVVLIASLYYAEMHSFQSFEIISFIVFEFLSLVPVNKKNKLYMKTLPLYLIGILQYD